MTAKQKQCLLTYLGYDTGGVDGLWGDKSRQATANFQKDYGLEPDGVFGDASFARMKEVIATGEEPKHPEDITGTFWDDIRYFDREEFRCKCGGKYCNGFPAEPQEKLIRVADRVREHFGNAMIVSSGLRCPTHNANSKGVATSRHLSGKAMDFCVTGFSADTVLPYVKAQKEIAFAYAIDSRFVHMDIL